jgi:hypothetical protein
MYQKCCHSSCLLAAGVDRNDDQDVEPVAHYEISLFKIFNDKVIEQ